MRDDDRRGAKGEKGEVMGASVDGGDLFGSCGPELWTDLCVIVCFWQSFPLFRSLVSLTTRLECTFASQLQNVRSVRARPRYVLGIRDDYLFSAENDRSARCYVYVWPYAFEWVALTLVVGRIPISTLIHQQHPLPDLPTRPDAIFCSHVPPSSVFINEQRDTLSGGFGFV